MAAGAGLGALAVALGAFGAHGLQGRVDAQAMEWWHTAAHYQLVHALAVIVAGLVAERRGGVAWLPPWLLGSGVCVFSGTLYAMALGAPRWLGAITPLGGLSMISGWVVLAIVAARRPPTRDGSIPAAE